MVTHQKRRWYFQACRLTCAASQTSVSGWLEEAALDDEARRRWDDGDSEKIDKTLKEQLNVSKTSTGKDQTAKPDTERSNSSSKNLDEQDD